MVCQDLPWPYFVALTDDWSDLRIDQFEKMLEEDAERAKLKGDKCVTCPARQYAADVLQLCFCDT